jgi:hypothetical protein
MLIIGNIGALDTESYEFIDRLLRTGKPVGPQVIEDGVLFSAPSSYRSVGVAFAHEDFAEIHWFQKLMMPVDQGPPLADKKQPPPVYDDSGVLFFAYTPPERVRTVEYRLIVNGLWTVDPLNPLRREDPATGIFHSVVLMPEVKRPLTIADSPSGGLTFRYSAPPGETITVAGDFNGWDPFMYELPETAPGSYSLTVPLPPGTYHYIFYHRGERRTDQYRKNTVYDKHKNPVSEAIVR